jgi:hypothetical protein
MSGQAGEIYQNDLKRAQDDSGIFPKWVLPSKTAYHQSANRLTLEHTGQVPTAEHANYLNSVVQRMGLRYVLKFVEASGDYNKSSMTVAIVELGNKP